MRMKILTALILAVCCLQNLVMSDASFYDSMTYFDSFLQGYKITDAVPNAYVCTKTFTESVRQFNYTTNFQNDPNHIWYEKSFNWTQYISGPLSDGYSNCTVSAYKLYSFSKEKNDKFSSLTDWLMGFV